jgi:hypothetical protein
VRRIQFPWQQISRTSISAHPSFTGICSGCTEIRNKALASASKNT